MILRLLAVAVIAFFLYRLVRRALARLAPPADTSAHSQDSQPIVPCKTCGTFVPRDRAVLDEDGHAYCSVVCRENRERHG